MWNTVWLGFNFPKSAKIRYGLLLCEKQKLVTTGTLTCLKY